MAPSVPSSPDEDPLTPIEVGVAGIVVDGDLAPRSHDLGLGVEHVADLKGDQSMVGGVIGEEARAL